MIDTRSNHSKSRPWLVVIDIRPRGLMNGIGEESRQEVIDTLWNAAIETGLPLIVVGRGGDIMLSELEDLHPAHVTFVETVEAALECLSKFRRFGSASAELNRSENGVFWISDIEGLDMALNDAQHYSVRDGIPKLHALSHRYRSDVMESFDKIEQETVGTVLLPLDLDLGSMNDPHLIWSHGRFVFDCVLLVEGQVAMAGFKVKALKELIVGYALVNYSLDNELFDGADELQTTLKRLYDGGARRVIGVCNGQGNPDHHHPFEKCVNNAGLVWRRTRWDELIAIPDHGL